MSFLKNAITAVANALLRRGSQGEGNLAALFIGPQITDFPADLLAVGTQVPPQEYLNVNNIGDTYIKKLITPAVCVKITTSLPPFTPVAPFVNQTLYYYDDSVAGSADFQLPHPSGVLILMIKSGLSSIVTILPNGSDTIDFAINLSNSNTVALLFDGISKWKVIFNSSWSGDITFSQSDGTAILNANVVSNNKIVQFPTNTILGNATALTANPQYLIASQVQSIIGFTGIVSGGAIYYNGTNFTTSVNFIWNNGTNTLSASNIISSGTIAGFNANFLGSVSASFLSTAGVGNNQMVFSSGTAQLIGSANYTVNGTGGITIAQTLTAAGGAFSAGVSGFNITGSNPACNIGTGTTGTNLTLAQASTAGGFFTGTVNGDVIVRQGNASFSIYMGVGSGVAQQVIQSSQVLFNTPIKLPTVLGTASPLSYYEDTTNTTAFTTNLAGAVAVSNVTIKIVRDGNRVNLELPDWSAAATASAAQVTSTALPTRFRPPVDMYFTYGGTNLSEQLMLGRVGANGIITWFGGGASTSTYTILVTAAARRTPVAAYSIA